MDIDRLKKQRQLNVQEQNALERDRIFREASFWRDKGMPAGLIEAFAPSNIDLQKSILLDYEQDFPGISTDEGTLLTEDERFFEFEADLNTDRTKLVELFRFEDITQTVEINEHKPGTGATFGFLAIEVLKELNQC